MVYRCFTAFLSFARVYFTLLKSTYFWVMWARAMLYCFCTNMIVVDGSYVFVCRGFLCG